MIIRWFITPIISLKLSAEEGGGIRRYPKLCYKDKYPCMGWSAVFFDDKALVRVISKTRGLLDVSDYIEELYTQEQWNNFYKLYPQLKNRWDDQP